MAKGIALTIGLNAVDSGHYQGWAGELNACENDANDMAAIAKSRGFNVSSLLTKDATLKNFETKIFQASNQLQAGDIFILSYSGHGGQVPDTNGDEDDGIDETWCLYDGQLIDDQMYTILSAFTAGVRILVLSDSCHSGTVTKNCYYSTLLQTQQSPDSDVVPLRARLKYMPSAVALRVYEANRGYYDNILNTPKTASAPNALLISGCQDNQYSSDGPFNGLFTGKLKRVWNGGQFKGDYLDFYNEIVKIMPPTQTPNYYWQQKKDPAFEAQIPFTI